MVSATPGHARSAAMARLGRLYSDVLSSSRGEDLVEVAEGCVAGGFRDCVESSEPTNELPSVTELIRELGSNSVSESYWEKLAPVLLWALV